MLKLLLCFVVIFVAFLGACAIIGLFTYGLCILMEYLTK